jgi:hypothetical protein
MVFYFPKSKTKTLFYFLPHSRQLFIWFDRTFAQFHLACVAEVMPWQKYQKRAFSMALSSMPQYFMLIFLTKAKLIRANYLFLRI